jgi:hypothetical protein
VTQRWNKGTREIAFRLRDEHAARFCHIPPHVRAKMEQAELIRPTVVSPALAIVLAMMDDLAPEQRRKMGMRLAILAAGGKRSAAQGMAMIRQMNVGDQISLHAAMDLLDKGALTMATPHAPGASAPTFPLEALLSSLPSLPRPILARITARMIERLDEMDGDPDLEANDDDCGSDEGEPDFRRRRRHRRNERGPGCAISDPDYSVDDLACG